MTQSECPFCHLADDPLQQVVYQTETCLFLQNSRFQQVLEGSGVIVPKAHRMNVFHLTEQEWTDTYQLLHKARSFIDERWHPDGYTIGWNVGLVSNQTIPHAHLHIVPRYNDETYAGRGIRYWIKQPENIRQSRHKPHRASGQVCSEKGIMAKIQNDVYE